MNPVVKVALPLAVLATGIGIYATLVLTRPEATKEPKTHEGPRVEVQRVEVSEQQIEVPASGTVIPARRVVISPEVSGRVGWVSEQLVPGGRFERGDRLLELDAREYQLAVEQQYANVDKARTELQVERGRKRIARREWELFDGPESAGGSGGGAPGGRDAGALALRKPQLRTAKATLQAAESGLERARLNVQRTRLSAPFNAMVQNKAVDVGQHVGPGSQLATLVGTDAFWVQVSIPVRQLEWLDVPGVGGVAEGEGSPADVWQSIGDGANIRRDGRVVKLLADVDPAGRMARVMIEIDDPLGLEDGASAGDSELPLLTGSYVEVAIQAGEVRESVEIPRTALRDGDRVFLAGANDRLEVRPVKVLWRRPESVLVSEGLASGDRVIVGAVPAPVEGMKLRTGARASDVADDAGGGGGTGAGGPGETENAGRGRDGRSGARAPTAARSR